MNKTLTLKVTSEEVGGGKTTFLKLLSRTLQAQGYKVSKDETDPHTIQVTFLWAAAPPSL
jgi:ABC-type bacteriocin/lantibiotic exporter with double-glycine peptidase domain